MIDDVFSYLVGDDEVFLMPNAANAEQVIGLLAAAAPDGVTVTDQHQDFAVLAVQGPKSAQVLQALHLPTDLDYVSFVDADFDGRPVRVCRTGYTGEHGYELIPAWDDAAALWDALVETARSLGGMPAGLGARDTLRTEMGYPLHGQDLTRQISPVQAGSSWAVGWKKPAFWGREALLAEKAAGPARRLRGLLVTDRGVPRGHMNVLDAHGEVVGQTTSGTFSPTPEAGHRVGPDRLRRRTGGVRRGVDRGARPHGWPRRWWRCRSCPRTFASAAPPRSNSAEDDQRHRGGQFAGRPQHVAGHPAEAGARTAGPAVRRPRWPAAPPAPP